MHIKPMAAGWLDGGEMRRGVVSVPEDPAILVCSPQVIVPGREGNGHGCLAKGVGFGVG